MKKFEHERIGKPKRRGCNSICFVQILCSLFLVGCLALLGYAVGFKDLVDISNRSCSLKQKFSHYKSAQFSNCKLDRWTCSNQNLVGLATPPYTWQQNNCGKFDSYKRIQNYWPGPDANPDISDYEHYWFFNNDISQDIALQLSDQVYDKNIVNLFNVTFDFKYEIQSGQSSQVATTQIVEMPALYGHVDRSSREDCAKVRTGYFNQVNQYCYYFTQLTNICLVVIQEQSSPNTYDLIPGYQTFPCRNGEPSYLDFVPYEWKNAPIDPVLSDIQTQVRVELRSDKDPYAWAKIHGFGEGSDIPESLQIVMGFILLCVALLLFIIPIRLLCFRKYLKRYTEENELRPHRYSNIV